MRPTILFVDDNEHQHKLIECFSMTLSDVDVRHAKSLQHALEEMAKDNVAVIFLDSRLPPYTDYRQTVPKLRGKGFAGKIVVVSSDIQDPVFDQFEDFDADDCLDKVHINLKSFKDIVAAYL